MMAKKLGIALAGGGARGAYQIGALNVLDSHGILDNIVAVSGSSVGSLNAVLLATNDLKKAHQTWLDLDHTDLFVQDDNMFKRFFEEKLEFIYKGAYNTDRLEEIIEASLDYDKLKEVDVYVATSHVGHDDTTWLELMSLSLRNMFAKETLVRYPNLRTMDKDTIRKTLLASCAIPIVFKPVVIDHETYYDGGVLDNTPYMPLINHGCDAIIVIDLYRFNLKRPKTVNGIPITYIYPSKYLKGILDFEPDKITFRMALGEYDAKLKIEEIQKMLAK